MGRRLGPAVRRAEIGPARPVDVVAATIPEDADRSRSPRAARVVAEEVSVRCRPVHRDADRPVPARALVTGSPRCRFPRCSDRRRRRPLARPCEMRRRAQRVLCRSG